MKKTLTSVVSVVGTVAGALVLSNSYPSLTPIFGAISAACAGLGAFTTAVHQ